MPDIVRPVQARTKLWQLSTCGSREIETFYRKLKDQLEGLDQNMQRYMILSVQAVTEIGDGVLEQKILEQTAQMDKYSKAV